MLKRASGSASSRSWVLNSLLAIAIGCGVVGLCIRLANWWWHPGFWQDEAGLALNIVDRDFSQLGSPFVYYQACGWAYLVVAKVIADTLGTSEYILRLLPLLSVLALPVLLLSLGRKVSSWSAGLIAASIVSVTPYLTYYSSEFKPYATDAFVTAILLLVAAWALDAPRRPERSALLVLSGTAAVWLSLPAIFTLAGIGLTVFLADLVHRHPPRRLLFTVLMGVAWLTSFALHYEMFLANSATAQSRGIREYWGDAFVRIPPRSLEEIRLLVGRFFYTFVEPGGFEWRYPVGLLFILGALILLRRSWVKFGLLIGPMLMVLVASALGKYPFEARLLVFLYPVLAVVIAVGFMGLLDVKRPWLAVPAMGFLCLLVGKLTFDSSHVAEEVVKSSTDVAKKMRIVVDRYQPGDRVYVEDDVVWQYDYYARINDFAAPTVKGTQRDHYVKLVFGDDGHAAIKEFQWYLGLARVWFLLPTWALTIEGGPSLDEWMTDYLDRHGRLLAYYDGNDVRAYLYDLTTATATTTATASVAAQAAEPP